MWQNMDEIVLPQWNVDKWHSIHLPPPGGGQCDGGSTHLYLPWRIQPCVQEEGGKQEEGRQAVNSVESPIHHSTQ